MGVIIYFLDWVNPVQHENSLDSRKQAKRSGTPNQRIFFSIGAEQRDVILTFQKTMMIWLRNSTGKSTRKKGNPLMGGM